MHVVRLDNLRISFLSTVILIKNAVAVFTSLPFYVAHIAQHVVLLRLFPVSKMRP